MARKVFVLASYGYSLITFRGELLKTLIDLGYSVHVGAPDIDAELRGRLAGWGCVIHEVTLERTGINPFSDFSSFLKLVSTLREVQPDFFIGYTIKPVIYGNLAAWLAGVTCRCALITGLGFAFTSKPTGVRRIISGVARSLYRMALSRATHVLFQNPDDLALFKLMKLVDAGKCDIVNGSGVDLAYYPKSSLPESPVFLYIGRLLTDKGIVEYVEAAKKVKEIHSDVRFLVAGWIDSNPTAIRQEQLDGWVRSGVIEFLGKLEDVRPAIEQCSVYVLPSYREGTPRTVLEAMSMGRAVITTDAPGCRETVVDGRNGYLVPVHAIEELADAMIQLINEPKRRTSFARESRLIAESKYDVHQVNQVILEYLGITGKEGSSQLDSTSPLS